MPVNPKWPPIQNRGLHITSQQPLYVYQMKGLYWQNRAHYKKIKFKIPAATKWRITYFTQLPQYRCLMKGLDQQKRAHSEKKINIFFILNGFITIKIMQVMY